MARISYSSVIPAAPEDVFHKIFNAEDWNAGFPSVLDAKVVEGGPVREGTELKLRVSRYGLNFLWKLRIDEILDHKSVTLHQTLGFFNSWTHTQTFEDHGKGQTLLKDQIEYHMPLGILGTLADDLIFRLDLNKMLESRHGKIKKTFS